MSTVTAKIADIAPSSPTSHARGLAGADPWSLPRPLAGCKTSRVGRLGLRLPLDLRPGLGLRPGLAGAVADGLVDDDGCRLTRDRLDQGRVHDLLHTGDLDRLVGALGG